MSKHRPPSSAPNPKDELPRTQSQDAVSSSIEDGFYTTSSFKRADTTDTLDDIYNICSRPTPI
jgi:hypothetical protein